MVLESIINATKAEEKKILMLGLGFLFSVCAAILAYALGGRDASVLFIAFTAIPAVPLMYSIIKLEEEKDLKSSKETKILKEHTKALGAFILLFLGMVLGMTLVFVVSPWPAVDLLFHSQLETLSQIQGSSVTGMVSDMGISSFNTIFFNNFKVLILALILSFLFGAGAIFILAWNASVIAAAIGSFIRSGLASATELIGFEKLFLYLETITTGLLMYSIHGVLEIFAYFVAALAGGIISVAVIRKDFRSANFESIVYDVTILFILSLFLLLVAALLEVFVTPLIFN